MPKITVNAVELNYNEFGAGNKGTPVLLQHGLGSQAKFMEPLAKLLVDRYNLHVYTADLAGYGLSGRREEKPGTDLSYSIESFAKDLLGFLDGLNIKKVILLGHSMGGMVAQIVAKDQPDRLEKLILLASSTFLKISGMELALAKMVPFKTVVGMTFKRAFPLDYPKDKMNEMIDESVKCSSRVAFVSDLSQMAKKHFFSEPWLPQIKVPTLVIGCEFDRSFGYEASKKIQSLIPGSILYTIKGGNHEAQVLHTEDVATAIGKFLGA
jgi:3-oxoadipate enol-lactonase